MDDYTRKVLEQIKKSGTNMTFEGGFVADFIEMLDQIIEVKGILLEGKFLRLLIGNPKEAKRDELLNVITRASLLNVAAAGYEETEEGKVLYLEYYIPPWSEEYLG